MFKKISFTYFLISFLISPLQAMERDKADLMGEIRRIGETYDLLSHNYSEDLEMYILSAQKFLSDATKKSEGKKLGIIVGENHSAEGAKCFQMLLLSLAKSFGIHQCLVEMTPEQFPQVMEQGYMLGQQCGFLQRLVLEARKQEMIVTPIDMFIEEKKEAEPLEAIKHYYLTGKQREEHFVKEIFRLNESFIYFTGGLHLSTLYYDPALNENFNLVFFSCSIPDSKEKKQYLTQVINMIEDPEVSRIHQTREKFLEETDRSYSMPIMLNQKNSVMARLLMESGPVMGINAQEVRTEAYKTETETETEAKDKENDGI